MQVCLLNRLDSYDVAQISVFQPLLPYQARWHQLQV